MTKLDEAFLKAYAKDCGAVPRTPPTVILSEANEETGSRMRIDSDDRSVVRCDEGVLDVAAYLGQSTGGRARGSAAPGTESTDWLDPAGLLSEGAGEPIDRSPDSLRNAEAVAFSFDTDHSLRGPHYQSVSLDLTALDSLDSSPAEPLAPPAAAPLPAAEPQAPARFQAVWEVDRFDFEETVCELIEPTSPLWEAGRQLQSACGEGLKVLAVTSPLPAQGRSTLAVILSRMVAATGLKVVLLDGDLDRPSVADKLRLEVQLGWDEAIRRGLPAEEAAVHSVEDQFTVLPLIPSPAAEPTHPPAAATAAMLDRLREAFDLVVIDTGTLNVLGGWIPGADRPGSIDAALVIQDARGDDPNAQQACLRRLERLGIANIGIVENFAD